MLDSTISGWNWVIATYALTWATLGIYTVYVMRRLTRAERAYASAPSGRGMP